MGKKRLSQLEFISQARQVHPTYDYSKSIYVNTDSKIIVTCSIHGILKKSIFVQFKNTLNLSSCTRNC